MRFAAAAAALALFAWALPAFADVRAPAVPTLSAEDGVIVPAKQVAGCDFALYFTPSAALVRRHFTPGAALVRRVEAGLAAAISAVADRDDQSSASIAAYRLLRHLATDQRFYVGVVESAGRFIEIHGWGFAHVPQSHGFACPLAPEDAGDRVWSIRFDVKRATFDHFVAAGRM